MSSIHRITLASLVILVTAPLAAQEVARPDAKALEAAEALAERRAPPESVAEEMARTYRQSPAQTAAILRSLRVSPGDAGGAVMGVYGLGGERAVSALASGGFTAAAVVGGMAPTGVAPDELVRGLRASGVPVPDAVGALHASSVPLEETVSALYRAEVPRPETESVVKETYDDGDGEILRAMMRAGYPVEEPRILRYWITDYSRPNSNARIENLGVVDPARVPGSGHPMDGRVTIEGEGLGTEGIRVTLVHQRGETEGEILSQEDGELEVAFSDFGSGQLRVESPGGAASASALALSHVTLSAGQLFDPAPSWTFGGDHAEIAWGFVGGGASTSGFAPTGEGLDVTVTGGDGEPVISIEQVAGEDACVRVTFSLQTTLTGSQTPRVLVWSCGSFDVDKVVCPTLTLDCILSHLAIAVVSSLGECSNLDNWEQRERDGVPIPIQGQGAVTVSYAANVSVDQAGVVTGSPAQPTYAGDLWSSIPYPPAHGPFVAAETWWDDTVVPALLQTYEQFVPAVVQRLGQWPQIMPQVALSDAELIGVHAQPDGTLLFAFSH